MLRRIFLTVGITMLLGVPSLAQKEKKPKPDRFTTVAVGLQGYVGGQTMRLDFIVNSWTTDEEILEYATILKEQGRDALHRQLEKVQVGRVSPTGRIGTDIAIARMLDRGDGSKTIRILTARNMPFFELRRGGRSSDYPYGIFEFTVEENGKGKRGAVVVAAKVQFDENDQLEIVTYGLEPIELRNIKQYKKKQKK